MAQLHRYAGFALAVAVAAGLVCGCSGKSTHPLSLTVLDSVSGRPVRAAHVDAGGPTGDTDSAGVVHLNGVAKKNATVKITAKYYDQTVLTNVTFSGATVHLTPIPVVVALQSNLTHKAIDGTVTAAGRQVRTKSGAATIYYVGPGDKIGVAATGYDTASVVVPPSRRLTSTLAAGPGVTAQYLGQAEIDQNYAVQVAFVHPDELKYVTAASIQAYFVQVDQEGYGTVSWKLASTVIVPTWHSPGCNGQGATTYRNVGAVEFNEVNSAPGGASQTTHGVEHFVKAPNGRWSWFPIVPGCNG